MINAVNKIILSLLILSACLIGNKLALAAKSGGEYRYWDNDNKTLSQKIYRQTINLDTIYTQIAFLNHLKKAAFTQEQISTTEKILFSLKSSKDRD